jgi:hypothetical protein
MAKACQRRVKGGLCTGGRADAQSSMGMPANAGLALPENIQFLQEIVLQGQSDFFGATHKKSLDLIPEGRKIGFVALHNLLFGLKAGFICFVPLVETAAFIDDYLLITGELYVFNP